MSDYIEKKVCQKKLQSISDKWCETLLLSIDQIDKVVQSNTRTDNLGLKVCSAPQIRMFLRTLRADISKRYTTAGESSNGK